MNANTIFINIALLGMILGIFLDLYITNTISTWREFALMTSDSKDGKKKNKNHLIGRDYSLDLSTLFLVINIYSTQKFCV